MCRVTDKIRTAIKISERKGTLKIKQKTDSDEHVKEKKISKRTEVFQIRSID